MNKLKSAKTKLGNTIELIGDKNAKILIIGVFHGDEPQGEFLINEYLKKTLSQKSIIHTMPES